MCGAASETEYASLYLNAQNAYFERSILSALGYPQPPTHMYADNSAAVGIANDAVKLKRSKAIDMRYHWLRDRVRQGIFKFSGLQAPKTSQIILPNYNLQNVKKSSTLYSHTHANT